MYEQIWDSSSHVQNIQVVQLSRLESFQLQSLRVVPAPKPDTRPPPFRRWFPRCPLPISIASSPFDLKSYHQRLLIDCTAQIFQINKQYRTEGSGSSVLRSRSFALVSLQDRFAIAMTCFPKDPNPNRIRNKRNRAERARTRANCRRLLVCTGGFFVYEQSPALLAVFIGFLGAITDA